MIPAYLVLNNGQIFEGRSLGAEGTVVGELVFNTAMTGYQEMFTDPSYAGQLLMLTLSQVGNTGCNFEDNESTKAWCSGVVIRAYSPCPSGAHYRGVISLDEWLKKNQVVGISDIDTRHLTHIIRESGAMISAITTNPDLTFAKKAMNGFQTLLGRDMVKDVTIQILTHWDENSGPWGTLPHHASLYHVVVVDFGVKQQILRLLKDMGCQVTVVPNTIRYDDICNLHPDGILFSNGPGDPAVLTHAIQLIQDCLKDDIPMFGICLGFQLLALALGAKTYKMNFGHHGANHPVIDLLTNRVYITSQNHGFAVDESTLPSDVMVTYRSLFDGTLQGFSHKKQPVFGFQGHPEGGPGPHDVAHLFLVFMAFIHKNIKKMSK